MPPHLNELQQSKKKLGTIVNIKVFTQVPQLKFQDLPDP